MGGSVPGLRTQLQFLESDVALQVPLGVVDFAARQVDFVANCQSVGHFIPCRMFGDHHDFICEHHFVQMIWSPHDEESGRECLAQCRGIAETASKLLAAASFLPLTPDLDRIVPVHACSARESSEHPRRSGLSSPRAPNASSSSVDRRWVRS